MRILYKQYEEDEEPTLDDLRGALLVRGYTIGAVRDDNTNMSAWSKESTVSLNVPLATVDYDLKTGLCALVEFEKDQNKDDGPTHPD